MRTNVDLQPDPFDAHDRPVTASPRRDTSFSPPTSSPAEQTEVAWPSSDLGDVWELSAPSQAADASGSPANHFLVPPEQTVRDMANVGGPQIAPPQPHEGGRAQLGLGLMNVPHLDNLNLPSLSATVPAPVGLGLLPPSPIGFASTEIFDEGARASTRAPSPQASFPWAGHQRQNAENGWLPQGHDSFLLTLGRPQTPQLTDEALAPDDDVEPLSMADLDGLWSHEYRPLDANEPFCRENEDWALQPVFLFAPEQWAAGQERERDSRTSSLRVDDRRSRREQRQREHAPYHFARSR